MMPEITFTVGVFTITPHSDGSVTIQRSFNGNHDFEKTLTAVDINRDATLITLRPTNGCIPTQHS